MRRGILFKMIIVAGGCALLLFSGLTGTESAPPKDVVISDLDFENADIRQVMKTLSVIGGVNIIVDKAVEGDCSLYLRGVTWKEAFIAVLKMNNLVGIEDKGFIKVISRTDYDSQQAALREEYEKRLLAERLGTPVNVHVMKIHNARAEDVKRTLDPLLGEGDRPSVDLRTNSLVFTVTDSSLTIINDIVRELDTETRQVSIEVKMVTVDAGATSEIGINWSAVKNGNMGVQTTVGEEGKLLLGTYAGKISGAAVEATLATLIDKNQAEVISRPHVTTQDNEAATISSGQQVPIITYDEARNSIINLVPAITQLTVTPHILSDDRILLEVHAQRSTAEGVGVGLKINEELADVKMITSNDETAVIGGMRQMQEQKHESGIPVLQDIPLLGQLFKYTKREFKRTDLIIFITPHIVSTIEKEVSRL